MSEVNKEQFAQRIQQMLDHHGDNPNQLATKIGKSNVNIYRMLDTKIPQLPTMVTIVAVLKAYPIVNSHWLLHGEGDMIDQKAKPAKNLNEFRELLDVAARLIPDENEKQWAVVRNAVEDSYHYIVDQMVQMHLEVSRATGEVRDMQRQLAEKE